VQPGPQWAAAHQFGEQSPVDAHPGRAEPDRSPGTRRVRVGHRGVHLGDPGGEQRVDTRWDAAVVRARFEGHHGGTAPGTLARLAQRRDLGVRAARRRRRPHPGGRTTGVEHNASHRGIRTRGATDRFRGRDGPAHGCGEHGLPNRRAHREARAPQSAVEVR
jgi:hypothetical protein